MSVISKGGTYVYYTDSVRVMKKESDFASVDEGDDVGVFMKVKWVLNQIDNNTSVNATGWRVVCHVPLHDDTILVQVVTAISIIMLTLLFFIIILSIVITVNWQLSPLGRIAEATDAIAQGNFNTKLPKVKGHSDISHLRDSFVSMVDLMLC